ncbi:MAG: hypothetical protein ACJA08_000803 [Cyclobacteriaceae bacterium]|jgi:hypothetical protein
MQILYIGNPYICLIVNKLISISLAFILLASHLSFAVGTHFCGGLAVKSELMIGHQHLDCGMAGMDEEHDADSFPYFEKTPCCQNEYTSIEVNDDFKPTINETYLNFEFVAAFINSFLQLPIASEKEAPHYTYYSPPLPKQDIQVLFQSFLI